jgi:hypothetical protein
VDSLGRHDPRAYPTDPVGYARNILRIDLSADQEKILRHLLIPPCIVNVPSGNDTGKTFLAAVAISWWYDSFNPGCCYTVAVRYEHLTDVLWAQLRILRRRNPILVSAFNGPRAPMMVDTADHLAIGITAAKGETFKGRHLGRTLFIFDEACGLAHLYFDELPTMFDPSRGDAALFIYNPTDTTSRMYQEDMRGSTAEADEEDDERTVWHRFPLSVLDHPNIAAELAGKDKPFPGAISLNMVKKMIRDGCDRIDPDERTTLDFEFPPSSRKFYRPGPWFQARGLGLWPDTGCGVWSDALFAACLSGPTPPFPTNGDLPEIGCDTATGKGEDFHAIHARWGKVSIHHETGNTMNPQRIGNRLKLVAQACANKVNSMRPSGATPIRAQQIQIKIDDDGTGGAIAAHLQAESYSVLTIGAGTRALDEARYPRKRDELWFQTAEKAKRGLVFLGLLDRATLWRLRKQLMAPTFELDPAGRRRVESKDDTKEKVGRSPDDADAFMLAWYDGPGLCVPTLGEKDGLRHKLYR